MESKIQIFKNDVFGEIRTMTNEKGETFFVGKDVAKALGYKDTNDAMKKHVDLEDKLTRQIADSGQRRMTPAGIDYLDMAVRKLPREMSANVQLYFNF